MCIYVVREGARELLIDLEIISDDFQFNHTISRKLIQKSGQKELI